ncbi:BON domain-containing protein [Acidiferrobacter sp.]|uniref:BON domain-containing protein n=1 Tax=Acidiferrobacter sp. TaxID=1872107 RepID=UPI00262D749B|nr:BON domain-containing protein [Acidiferrobacter sp.]
MRSRAARSVAAMVLAAALASALTGCTPLLVGGAATGASVASGGPGAGTMVDDTFIKFRAEAIIAAHKNLHRATHVDVTCVNGRLLLTGEANNVQDRARILDLVRGIRGIRQIIDQLRLAPPSSFASRLANSWITLRVKSALAAKGLDVGRITVVTAHRVVYLLGIVPRSVGNRAALAASVIPHVRSIIELFQYPVHAHDRR